MSTLWKYENGKSSGRSPTSISRHKGVKKQISRSLSKGAKKEREMKMPVLDVVKMTEGMNETEKSLIQGCFHNFRLRATKPWKRCDGNLFQERLQKACVNYCWRWLCFTFVNEKPHNCTPVGVDFDLMGVLKDGGHEDWWEKAKEVKEILDEIIRRAENKIDILDQKGVCRWLTTGVVG